MYKKRVVFSDLDGTLLDDEYSFEDASGAIEILKDENVPLVICTSKTRAEIEVIRKKLGNRHPFISENGGAIFIPRNYFGKSDRKIKGGYEVIEFGTSYKKLTKSVRELKRDFDISSFAEMSSKEVSESSGLDLRSAKLAKSREYDEVFILGERENEKKLLRAIKGKGLNYTRGGRYHHILGENDKGKAVSVLTELYKQKFGDVFTISFGDAKNDIPMLKKTNKGFFVKGPADLNERIIKLFGVNRDFVRRGDRLYKVSLKFLRKFRKRNGAILASFPKSRYPYVYPRDHSICTLALIDAGYLEEARKSIEFILKSQNKNGSFPQRLNSKGEDASYKPIQLDNTALVLYCFARYVGVSNNKLFLKKYRSKIKKSLNYLKLNLHKNNLFFTPNSIHEFPPIEEGLEIWANSCSYACLRELEKIGVKTNFNLEKIKKSIGKYFWNGSYFIKTIRLDESSSVLSDPDASSYSPAYFGIFEDDDKKVEKTVKIIEKELWHRKLGGICRYKKSIGRNNGGWGPWPHFTLMICRHYINKGDKKKAEKYIKWVLDVAQNNKLPEHISTVKDFEEWVNAYKSAGILRKDREVMIKNIRKNKLYKKGLAYSVLPLAWPHAEFIRTWLLYKGKFL